jgi:RNA polymerase sigma factor (sigma-70 family)
MRDDDDYDDDSNNNDDAVAEDRRQDAMTVLVTSLRDYNDAPEQFQDYIFDKLHNQLDVSEQLYVNSMIRPLDDDTIGTIMPHEGAVVHRFWSRGLDDLDGMYRKRRGGRRGGLSSTYNELEEAGDEYYEEGNDQAWLRQQLQEQERFAVRSYVDRIPDTDTVTDYEYDAMPNNEDDDDDDDQLRLEDVLRTNLAKVLASTLTSQQLQVLQHVYGLQGGTTTTTGSLLLPPPPAPLTVDETARKLGLSRPRVERLLDRALTRLRRAFAEMYLSSGGGDGGKGGHHRRIPHDDDQKKMGNEEKEEEDHMIFEEDST